MKQRLLEFVALLFLGDGILTAIDPKRHCLLWEVGPKPIRDLLDEFAEHPEAARWFGVGQALLAIAVAQKQKPNPWPLPR